MSVILNYILPPDVYAENAKVQFEFDSLVSLINTELATLAPVGATYVTLSTNSTLTNERVLTGTSNQIIITDNGAGSTVVLSTPQNIHTAATPTFASETLTATSNQLVLGTTRTVTLTAPTPASSSRTVTFPDLSTDYSVVGASGTQIIGGQKIFSTGPIISVDSINYSALTLLDTSNGQTAYLNHLGVSTAVESTWSVNRSVALGASAKTDQAAAWITLQGYPSDGAIYFATTATNNAAPLTRLTIDKNGLVTADQGLTVNNGATTINGTATVNNTLTVATASSTALSVAASSSGGTVGLLVDNTSNTASSDTRLFARVAGSSAGDPYMQFNISGVRNYSLGIDNSDSDKFKICVNATLTSDDAIVINSSRGVSIYGTNTNDDAATGFVGEYIESNSGLSNLPTTGNFGDLTSISLTAGDWLVAGWVSFNLNGATMTEGTMGIHNTSGNSAPSDPGATAYCLPPTTVANTTGTVVVRRSLSSTTTVYLKYEGTYSVGTPRARGHIGAWRIR